jgi:hypothetical protein
MAIAVMPERPEDPWERRGGAFALVLLVVVLLLFAYSMLDAYVL